MGTSSIYYVHLRQRRTEKPKAISYPEGAQSGPKQRDSETARQRNSETARDREVPPRGGHILRPFGALSVTLWAKGRRPQYIARPSGPLNGGQSFQTEMCPSGQYMPKGAPSGRNILPPLWGKILLSLRPQRQRGPFGHI